MTLFSALKVGSLVCLYLGFVQLLYLDLSVVNVLNFLVINWKEF